MSTDLVPVKRDVFLSPVMSLQTANSRLEQFQQFVAGYLSESRNGGQDGGDYGAIPGAGAKKVLLKSGADKLCEIYGIYDEYEVESHENFETNLFFYRVKCILKSRSDDSVVGTGLGSCSTYETKYRYRDSQRKCPVCQATAIIKGKEEYGGGWLCWDKKGGCKAKFKAGDPLIEDQKIGRVENPDILDTVNTVLKMAKKRAKIDAVIGVTRSSGIFTQDLDDVAADIKTRPVEVTTEDIPLSKPSAGDVKGNPAGTQAQPEPPAGPAETIGQGEQVYLHRKFRESLPESLRDKADILLEQWLKNKKFTDKDGRGTAKNIDPAVFQDVVKKSCEWAAAQK